MGKLNPTDITSALDLHKEWKKRERDHGWMTKRLARSRTNGILDHIAWLRNELLLLSCRDELTEDDIRAKLIMERELQDLIWISDAYKGKNEWDADIDAMIARERRKIHEET